MKCQIRVEQKTRKKEVAIDANRNNIRDSFADPIVQRLGHCPFTAVTRVRIPLGSPLSSAFAEWLESSLRANSDTSAKMSKETFPNLYCY